MSLKKRLVIAGAGSFGREVWQWAKDIHPEQRDWESVVFINDELTVSLENIIKCGISSPIISTIDDYIPEHNDLCVCAVADPKGKLSVVDRLIKKNVVFTNIIHPTCKVGIGCKVGTGIILCPYSVLTVNVKVGNYVIINIGSSIGHDAQIGDGVTISAHCDITGFSKLDKGCFIGSGARTLPKSRIGEFATVGAGSVVLKKVQANRAVFGNPAYYIK
ncbi:MULTISPECIES: hypothetical protein [Paenibacillus]|uniref:hypothetical protein n=1 Tax=Paenibacillus TaxID=44249 RepID=UPI000C9F3354|nr:MULTISPECIES: hypothetical protein [Paenibacillus]MDY7991535.1 hypothetical protein [Paenibacillus polymyxa]MDY8117976.1 hypothetical protein [Paenibacillus polymyxa]PNQ82575.1 hypothetical protein C1T21_05000 [Paenibacillus sp. F4]